MWKAPVLDLDLLLVPNRDLHQNDTNYIIMSTWQ